MLLVKCICCLVAEAWNASPADWDGAVGGDDGTAMMTDRAECPKFRTKECYSTVTRNIDGARVVKAEADLMEQIKGARCKYL
jgi:hypothetical protein